MPRKKNRPQGKALTVFMAAVTLIIRLCSCFLFKVFFLSGKEQAVHVKCSFMDSLVLWCVTENLCVWAEKTQRTTSVIGKGAPVLGAERKRETAALQVVEIRTAALSKGKSTARRQRIHSSGLLESRSGGFARFYETRRKEQSNNSSTGFGVWKEK